MLSESLVEEVECEGLERVFISNDKEKYFQNAYEAPGLDPSFICHHLNVNLTAVPRKHPPRLSSKEHSEAVKEDVIKLKQAGAIKEVFYPEWLTNIVVVIKKNGKRRFKEYLSQPLVMSRPDEDEVLFAYIVVAFHAISLVLIRVDNGVQRPVYYVSKSLHEAEIRYLPLEKAILAEVHATRAFDIKYMPRTSVKGQVLSDLVAEFAEPLLEENTKKSDMDEKSVSIISLKESLSWKVYVNGVANQRGSIVGLVVISPDKIVIEKSLRMDFLTMNNEAEYEALLVGMTMVQKMGGKTVEMFSNLRFVVGQVEGELEAKDPRMQEYLSQIRVGPSWMDPIVLYLKEYLRTSPRLTKTLPEDSGNKRWLLVGMDYFTKWVETKPLSNIRDLDAKRFVWKNIVTQFGIPHTLILDNGLQFDSEAFRRYCCDLGITNRYSTLVYLQENGQAETVNKVIVNGFKKRLDDAKKK
ncbi:uncharacterized protein LOC142644264 [Castanea sativa]|uniref:uncharacterized protein LOC142644264 n=1 Tax=Castanea sativa TaxID=21020 RepID=UPI003F64B7CC